MSEEALDARADIGHPQGLIFLQWENIVQLGGVERLFFGIELDGEHLLALILLGLGR
jgi:hypothetical protein